MAAAFAIVYAPQAVADIRAIRAFERTKVMEAIALHLSHEPTTVSRSRIERMTQPFWSQFRLRVDDLRVYYDVDEPARQVNVLRVLAKGTQPTPTESP